MLARRVERHVAGHDNKSVQIVKADAAWYEHYTHARRQAFGPEFPINYPLHIPVRPIPAEMITMALVKAHKNGLGYFFPTTDALILVPSPIIRTDAEGRLHSLTEPAVNWPGGEKFYLIRGVRFDKPIWQQVASGKVSVPQVLGFRNIEQRTSALSVLPPEQLIQSADARRISSEQGYELFLITRVFDEPAYFLKYTCPSTGKTYVSGVPPTIGEAGSALKALKWKFHLERFRGRALFTAQS
jgi:hypothetical protein